jgi:toxin ParE1/3/4
LTEVRLAPAAARDLASIVKWTRKEFGAAATLRYRTLIEQALIDIGENPERAGSMQREGVLPLSSRLYSLALSRKNVKGRGVTDPRHFLVYQIKPEFVWILRILHDSRDLKRHV